MQPDDKIAQELLRLQNDRRQRRGDKTAQIAPYRELIVQLRAAEPPRTWDEIVAVLQNNGIDISRSALARAFREGSGRRAGLNSGRTKLRSIGSSQPAADGTGGTPSTITHGPQGIEM